MTLRMRVISCHACLQLTVIVLCLMRCTVAARHMLHLVARIHVGLCILIHVRVRTGIHV